MDVKEKIIEELEEQRKNDNTFAREIDSVAISEEDYNELSSEDGLVTITEEEYLLNSNVEGIIGNIEVEVVTEEGSEIEE